MAVQTQLNCMPVVPIACLWGRKKRGGGGKALISDFSCAGQIDSSYVARAGEGSVWAVFWGEKGEEKERGHFSVPRGAFLQEGAFL